MSIENWPALPSEDDGRHDFEDAVMRSDEALSIRLRATAAALKALLDSAEFWAMQDRASRKASGSMSEQDYKTWRALSYGSTSWGTARAILAQLKTEGLT